MNILFIDYDNNFNNKFEKYIYKFLGIYIRKYENIYYLSINSKYYNKRFLNLFFKLFFRKKTVYVLLSRRIAEDEEIVKKLSEMERCVIVTEQNNLVFNDNIYIDKYLKDNKLKKQESSVLIVTDRLDYIIKDKIYKFINEYKTIDILTYGKALYFDVKDFIDNINNEYGSTIETLDKRGKKNYNVILVFKKQDKEKYNKSSFILDYNNSDMDIESNTYKVYLKYKDEIEYLFSRLNMNIYNFEKTKLGKLYIHKKWNTLDK